MAHSAAAATAQYNYDIVKKFAVMALVWGVLGMSAGTYIAAELAFPFLNFDIAEITFGRLRPVHTTLVIFGFGGSALFATSYYVVQRTSQARLASDWMANLTFWGWQLSVLVGIIAGAYSGTTLGGPVGDRLRLIGVPAEFADDSGFALVIIATTYFSLVVGELVPKQQTFRTGTQPSSAAISC